MGKDSKVWDWQAERKVGMGEQIAKAIPFMKETALLHFEERELIAWLRIFELLNKDSEDPEIVEFNKWIDETAIPAFQILGRSRWYRDTITDLSLGMAYKKKDQSSTIRLEDILKQELEKK